ncbi:DUF300-domain-containing protein [Teratosphaeria destructans]|uniref:DUF300-domain-containing protein n=1 Tax=Teratosphaeria destructans TaxID=418781 RepID=A0A9W7W4R7_9PEZI|nr:DUF300-domain-containing protein [Teratosphaeria destructans]
MTNWTYCNTTLEDSYISEVPIFSTVTFHHLGLFLAAVFGGISIIIAMVLVMGHATHYLRPWEQKHIIRILLMIPIYSGVSFLSFVYYRKAVYWEVIGNCYEAFAIASFFTLLCHYIAPNLHEQKEYFRGIQVKNWFLGVFWLQKCTGGENRGPFRKPRSGLTWFNIIWIGVFQYCFIRVAFTIAAVITQYFGVYCEASLSPVFAHIWVTAFEAASVTVAMFCLIQFYIQLKDDLAEHKPFLKVLCIKLVIFFSFWQTRRSAPADATLGYQDIKVGIPDVLLCIEMAIFAVMHIFAFPWKPYNTKNVSPLDVQGAGYSGGAAPKYRGGPLGIKAVGDVLNPWDLVKASARGCRWMFVGYRQRTLDPSYQNPNAKLGQDTGYMGPTFAGSGGAATELRPSDDMRGRAGTLGAADEDDRAGLLHNSSQLARMPSSSPYRTYTHDSYDANDGNDGHDSRFDPGNQHSMGMQRLGRTTSPPDLPAYQQQPYQGWHYPQPPQPSSLQDSNKSSDHGPGRSNLSDDEESEDTTAYHPGFQQAGTHPALRTDLQDPRVQQWDHWAGAQRPGDGGGGGYNAR